MFAAVAVLAGAALGPSRAAAWEKYSVGTVANLQVYSDGSFNVALTGITDLCTGPTGQYAGWNKTNGRVATTTGFGLTAEGVKAFYAALLGAQLSGKSVRLYAGPDSKDPANRPCAIEALDVMN